MMSYKSKLQKKRLQLKIKRMFDVVTSLMMIVVLFPVFIAVAIWIKLDSKGPIIYKQKRVTQNGRIFNIFKFRTMKVDADKGDKITMKDDCRITKVGKKIRKKRLDELPQLFNILSGDMSFVGTRPEAVEYVKQYDEIMKATLLLPAGVTSRASVEFKDEDEIMDKYVSAGMSVNDAYMDKVLPLKMAYNLEYVDNFSIFEDIKILIKTVLEVIL